MNCPIGLRESDGGGVADVNAVAGRQRKIHFQESGRPHSVRHFRSVIDKSLKELKGVLKS